MVRQALSEDVCEFGPPSDLCVNDGLGYPRLTGDRLDRYTRTLSTDGPLCRIENVLPIDQRLSAHGSTRSATCSFGHDVILHDFFADP